LTSRLATVALIAAVAAWLVLLRPTALGGTTGYVLVAGPSMLPTYHVGDLVLTSPAALYDIGTIVVYRIPAGEPGAGRLVVHRLVGGSAETGFTTQGDHNGYTDVWHPRPTDIVGSPVAVIPRAGVAIQILRQPVVAATIAAVVVMLLLWPRRGHRASKPEPLPPRREIGRAPHPTG
jgi:signal peptidase